jgi:acyl dehydratase
MTTLSADLVGRRMKGLVREVTWRETTNHAAAVGETNARYLDDSRDGGIVAPPLFAACVTWPMMADVDTQLPGALSPAARMTMVHATESLTFHRPIRPGDVLTVSGEVAAVVPERSGTRVVLRLVARDAAGGPVFTEEAGALFRGVPCDGDGGGAETEDWAAMREGADASARWDAEVLIPRGAAHVYDGCTDIVFAIHTSVAFARAVGLPDILYQGTATLAHAARELLDREADGDPSRLAGIACRFTGMVVPGTAIRVQRLAAVGDTVPFRVINAEGKAALRGVARARAIR